MFHRQATSLPELPAADQVVSTMSDLINAGQFRDAIGIAATIVVNPSLYEARPEYAAVNDSAQFHFQASLAYSLMGRKADAKGHRKAATRCPDYEPAMMADFIRDKALRLIRKGRPLLPWKRQKWHAKVAKTIAKSCRFFNQDADPLRNGASVMTEGRLQYALGRYESALASFLTASNIWHGATEKNLQWERNNRFATMRAAARIHKLLAMQLAEDILNDTGEANLLRKKLAGYIANPSLPAGLIIRLYDFAERVMVRR